MSKKRFLEILPGFLSWNIILFLIWGGYLIPTFTAYFILAFDVYWVYTGMSMILAAMISHLKIQAAQRLDWLSECRGFGDWQKVRHIVLILVGNEPVETFERTVEELSKQTLPLKQIAVVLATEGRFPSGNTGGEKL